MNMDFQHEPLWKWFVLFLVFFGAAAAFAWFSKEV